jgi:hypothetical protein
MTEPTTPLRRRMIEDMTIRNMSPSAQKIYVRAVTNFSIYHGRSPDKFTSEDVRDYRLDLIARGLKAMEEAVNDIAKMLKDATNNPTALALALAMVVLAFVVYQFAS